ncbi:phage protein Gp27 family protein [Magnetovibrio sp.]|uniref:phage protein Gp27 family protein n=1 Tax=Magnetovibrio sp. TaxID=2024836 RepID=UPI002F926674
MGQKSKIETELEEEDRKALDQLIMSGKWTIDELLEWLGEKGYDTIRRSSLGRHKQNIEKLGAKLRESRVVTEALVKELGPDVAEGKHGRLLVEVLRNIAFDLMVNDGDDFNEQSVFFLAKALKDMASANKIDLDRELKIRESVAKEMVKKLDAAVEESSAEGEPGLSPESIAKLRRDFLGVPEKKNG